MNFLEKINNRFLRTNSHLCIGLDPDPQKIPEPFGKTPDQIFHFLEEVIEATSEYALALKPNLAYFEALGLEGIRLIEKVLKTIPEDIPVIADAKRGDIGPSSKKYAFALLEQFGCDAITVSPYMGYDSIEPKSQGMECSFESRFGGRCNSSGKGLSDPGKIRADAFPYSRNRGSGRSIGEDFGSSSGRDEGALLDQCLTQHSLS